MIQSFIIESNQTIAKKNYSIDYGKVLNETDNNTEISNSKWKIKLPKSIKLEPGDRISYYQSAIKQKGLSNEGIELLGKQQTNDLMDNKMKIDLGYYVSNNWLNNTPLPIGLATLREKVNNNLIDVTKENYRDFLFQDTFHQYYITDETTTFDSFCLRSDYGGPSLGTQPATGQPVTESDITPWLNNSSVSLNERADDLDSTKYIYSNANAIASNNMKLYRPDTTRFYLNDSSIPFTGFYNNGYDTFNNISLTGTYNKKWIPLKTQAVVQSPAGFNSPVVVGQKITESLNNPILEGDSFVKPQVIDYKNVSTNTTITNLKNHYKVRDQLQVSDETCHNYPTSFGKMIYDLNNGVDSFSINSETNTKTLIPFPSIAQRAKYFWNSLATADINRTQAISELYEDLKNSVNVVTLNPANLSNSSFYTGSIVPEASLIVAENYAASQPYNFGEQMVLFDDLDGYAVNFTQTEIDKITSNIIFRSDLQLPYASVHKPSLSDKHLNLQSNNVIMTNMIANDNNFNKLKKVFDLLEKPSSDTVKIDYNDQTFLDTLYASFEIGRLDDKYTQSTYNIVNFPETSGVFRNTTRIGNGIPNLVALPPPQVITQKYEVNDAASRSYIDYKGKVRLPIYAGLMADEDNISELEEIGSPSTDLLRYTYINELNDNKMYQYDYFTRYNNNRIPSSNNVNLPSNTSFDFRDANGNYFDDTKIKELGLGCVVGYKNIIERGGTALQFGLGSQPAASQFSLYSVDTTSNYSVNTGVFVNKSSDSDLQDFGDNSVQSLTTNNTVYLTQNTTNVYSESTNLQTISTTNAMVIEYEATKPFIPIEIDLYQQASYPDPSIEEHQSILGAGVSLATFTAGGGTVVVNTTFGSSADSHGFDNITGAFDKCLVFNSTWTITIDVGVGVTKKIEHFRMWARSAHSPNETPTEVELFGSNDNFTTQTSLFNGTWLQTDLPAITVDIVPSDNLNLSLKKDLTTTGDFRYYKFQFPAAPASQFGYYSIGELALYEKVESENAQSRFPKSIQIQGQQINSTTWSTLDTHSLVTEPLAAGASGSTLPQNPTLSGLTPPFVEKFNQSNLSYKKIRLIITETFGLAQNNVNIGEFVLTQKNNFTTYLGDATSPFSISDLELKAYLPTANIDLQFIEDPNTFVNFNPAGSPSQKNAIRDGDLSTDMDLTLNTTATYSTTANQVIIGTNQSGGERIIGLEYKLTQTNPLGEVFNDFLIYTSSIVSKLPFLPKSVIIMGITEDGGQEGLFDGDLATTLPSVATNISISSNSPYGAKTNMNSSNDRFKSFLILIKSTFNISTNRCVIPDVIVSGYDSANHIVHNTPFIGMVCREQITSKDKYKIPLPISEGEFTGLSRSMQNNEWSFINSWEREVINDDRGVILAKIQLTKSTILDLSSMAFRGSNPLITADFIGGQPDTEATVSITQTVKMDGVLPESITMTALILTSNGSRYVSPPAIRFFYQADGTPKAQIDNTDTRWHGQPPEVTITMGDFKTSYTKGTIVNNQPNFPYITVGANNIICEFDQTESRMNFNKMHTMMKQGQASNGLSRYYNNSMLFNSAEPLISPDAEASNDVMKIHAEEFYVNSCRAGFTIGIAKKIINDQIIPISNPFINSKGIASALSGIGITGLEVAKSDDSFVQVSQTNIHTYNNCLFDKLGFKLSQLLPFYGNQNQIFNRGKHNKFVDDNTKSLSQFNNCVKPVTTGGFISASLNQSLNTSDLGFLMGSLDGNNELQKSVAQVSDSLIGINLPEKYAYSHLLLYSNIVNKYNYIGGQIINDICCVGSINRSYSDGDFIYGNVPGIEYMIDKTKILTDIDVDIRTNLGTQANLGEGSTITFKIDKFRQTPLALQNNK